MSRVLSGLKWLIPGMRVKRWLVLIILGAVVMNFGSVCALGYRVEEWWGAQITLLNLPAQFREWLPTAGYVAMVLGLLTMLISAYLLVRSIARVLDPEKALRLADVVYQHRMEQIFRGYEIVVVGGGTGLSTMIRGLKKHTGNITAIVTVSDDGGSSGRLQRELGMLPPGDIRNCLVALADQEPLMTALFNHRFKTRSGADGGLGGHSLGNIFLAALTELNDGNFDQAVKAASRVLAVRGQVLPSSTHQLSLVAEMKDGSTIQGETAIVGSRKGIRQIRLEPEGARTFPEVIEAIHSASVVVIGPGSVYTSVIPNLLVTEIRQALEETDAVCIYVCNVMTQPGETDSFSAADHLEAIETQTGFTGIDYALVNVQQPGPEQLERYRRGGADWVRPDLNEIRELGYEPIGGNFISETNLVRHDSEALAKEIFSLLHDSGAPRKRKVRSRKPREAAHTETAADRQQGATPAQNRHNVSPPVSPFPIPEQSGISDVSRFQARAGHSEGGSLQATSSLSSEEVYRNGS